MTNQKRSRHSLARMASHASKRLIKIERSDCALYLILPLPSYSNAYLHYRRKVVVIWLGLGRGRCRVILSLFVAYRYLLESVRIGYPHESNSNPPLLDPRDPTIILNIHTNYHPQRPSLSKPSHPLCYSLPSSPPALPIHVRSIPLTPRIDLPSLL